MDGKEAHWAFQIQPWVLIYCLGFSCMIGILSGLYPAYRLKKTSLANILKGE